MLETLAQWSRTRLWWTLGIGYAVVLEGMSWLTSRIPPCVVPTQIGEQSDGTKYDYCPAFHSVLFELVGFLEDHGEALTALATIAIATFTWTLWKATDRLWHESETQRTENKTEADRQFKITNDALALARDEFLSGNRPRIRFKHVWLIGQEFVYSKPVVVRVLCVNTGVHEATLIEYAINFFVVVRGRMLPIPDFEGKKKVVSFTAQSGITLILPDESYDLSEADEIEIRRGSSKFYCVGYLHYRDGIGRIRTSAFCRVLSVPDGAQFTSGRRFVKVDDPDYEYED